MKSCATCFRVYGNDAAFCASDGSPLVQSESIRPVSKDPRVGTVIASRYSLQRKVADGAMGRVYDAIDLHSDTQVAVKVLHPNVAKDRVAVARFHREFEVSRALAHPHVVAMREFIPIGSLTEPAIVMDYLEGRDLGAVLQEKGTVSYGRLMRMLSQVSLALDDAHAQGYVHRDLKPENILLCGTAEGDDVKILDFGSVKDSSVSSLDMRRLTAFGTTIGSPYYMAPEQAEGKADVDGRADVYALAVIAYECVSGKVPFSGTTPMEILMSVLSSPARSLLDSDLTTKPPRAFDVAIQKGLAKKPDLRQPTTAALVEELGHALSLKGDVKVWAATPAALLETAVQSGAQWAATAEHDPFASHAGTASHAISPAAVAVQPRSEAVAAGGALVIAPTYADADAPPSVRSLGSFSKGGLRAAGLRVGPTMVGTVEPVVAAHEVAAAPTLRAATSTTEYRLPVTRFWTPLRLAAVLFVLAGGLITLALKLK